MIDAEEIKQELGQQAKDIIARGLNFVEKSGKVMCPLHADKHPSMSWYKDGLMWRCHACDEKIDIYRYYTDFENMKFLEAVEKVAQFLGKSEPHFQTKTSKPLYSTPNIKMVDLNDTLLNYMAKRKISKQTLTEWNVKQGRFSNKDVYVFQYFKGTELIYVSYREPGKSGLKGGCEKDTLPILWGMWHIDKTKPLVITEGQPDAMSIWEAGYKNVVSVPSGSNNLTWIDNCWGWLQDIKQTIVYADNDKPGLEMGEKIKLKLKNVKVITSTKHKDANEDLYYEGGPYILELINKAINETPEGLIDVSRLEYKTLLESEHEGIETGFIEYDEHVEDWKEQELTIVFGRNGEGKTTFLSQVIAHNLMKKNKVFLYSGEMSEWKIQDWLYKQIAGNKEDYFRYIKCKYKTKAELKIDVVIKIKKWHEGNFYLFDRSSEKVIKQIDSFFNIMSVACSRYGVKLFVIDNLMSILEDSKDNLNSEQSNFVQKCKDFAINKKVHVVLLAHPNKLKNEITVTDANEGNLTKLDISGSNNIANKADNIIAVERNFADNAECDAIITSLKDRESGERKVLNYQFSKKTLRFYNDRTKELVNFGWESKDNMKLNPKYAEHEELPY